MVYGKTNANRGFVGTIVEDQNVGKRWKYFVRWNGHGDSWVFVNSLYLLVPAVAPIPEIESNFGT